MSALNFILAESALELVPERIANHPSVLNYARRRKKRPTKILLDRSVHHAAMSKLPNALKRGRPDIVHLTLLNLLCSPLNRRGLLKIYVHTNQNKVIRVNRMVRLPKNYNRFVGLMEQLFEAGRVPPKGVPLLSLKDEGLPELINELRPSRVVAFTTLGKPTTLQEVCRSMVNEPNPAVLVGGFPHGHFSKETLKLANEAVKVYEEALEAWVIAARIAYSYELALGINF